MTDTSVHTKRTTCRLCDSPDFDIAFRLEPTPPANAYLKSSELNAAERCFPLDLYVCRRCHHAQLLDIVDPSVMFRHYAYVSGTSPVFVQHLSELRDEVLSRCLNKTSPFMVEIGSNDGTLLKLFKDKGIKVLGVEPATNLAVVANENGRPTLNAFFNSDTADAVRAENGGAHIICANNVLAHIDPLQDVFAGIKRLMDKDGICVFEVSYLVDVIEKGLFDTIYHEHVSYHAVGPMIGFLERAGLQLCAAQRIRTQGGSIRFFAQHAGGPYAMDKSVTELLATEAALGLDTLKPFAALAERIAQSSRALRDKINQVKAGGARVAGYGAPAKITTLMHHFKLGAQDVEFLIEDNPLKQGLYTPGKHVPIVDTAPIYKDAPDYLVIFAWNFARPIIEKHRTFADKGGRFVIPLPTLREVGPDTIDQYLQSTTN
jgi:SAM-dependent methyltransferase